MKKMWLVTLAALLIVGLFPATAFPLDSALTLESFALEPDIPSPTQNTSLPESGEQPTAAQVHLELPVLGAFISEAGGTAITPLEDYDETG
ncbi:MAG: hypothetical protein LBS58_05005, partial [Coriobacteriales bacterium]|nr:hypothetical protein [Coriobacteriales bacterium]